MTGRLGKIRDKFHLFSDSRWFTEEVYYKRKTEKRMYILPGSSSEKRETNPVDIP